MSWIPSVPRVLVLLESIEAGKNPLQDCSDLFWLFCIHSMPPEEFRSRMASFEAYHARQVQSGGGFTDPGIEAVMLQGFKNPEKAAQVVLDRLDAVSKMKQVPYQPDEADDPTALYVVTHIEATRLVRLLRVEGYSDEARSTLQRALQALARCEMALGVGEDKPAPKEYAIALAGIGSYLFLSLFLLQKSDGEYEEALHSQVEGITRIRGAIDRNTLDKSFVRRDLPWGTARILEYAPWTQGLEGQASVGCFEALRNGGRIRDVKSLATACDGLVCLSLEGWLSQKPSGVEDAEGNTWESTDFWHHAGGWVEAQLRPSELRELLQEREDQDAERRLCTYFFDDEVWGLLPERAKSSLVSADRDWFGGTSARTASILNELRITAEELLLHGLWMPLGQWIERQGGQRRGVEEFLRLKNELVKKGLAPGLFHFERTCRMQITRTFLVQGGVSTGDREWFVGELPRSLKRLRKARRSAEHESVNASTRGELRPFVADFVGIGRRGLLPRLAKILFPVPHTTRPSD